MATRAKDSDRDVTCKALDDAFSEGQISTEEHRQRIAVATQAQTLGELNGVVSDLQIAALAAPTLPAPPPRRRRWPAFLVTAAVAAAVGAGAGVYVTRPVPPDPGAADDGVAAVVIAPTKLFSVPGLSGLLDQMRAKFGDTNGIELTVRASNASLVRIESSDPELPITYPYQGGFRDGGAMPGTWRNVHIGDLSRFDPAKVVGVLRGAPQTLNVPNAGDGGTVMVIKPTENGVDITITVSEKDRSGRMVIAGNGESKEVAPAP
ncbi:DUF1707 domain-containing protein [Mycobacterium sp. CBMA271]|uniref:DUF1707 SHOCT-like domain-containing protein n=1 Tax=unclassified Mycobacteroides TaxID=2618759 RepID=UPI0012DD6184|nr:MULTISPECIES: DUF1707 domain-containing protein [unclassified Mycobacteroides]MUM17060.1 hypothetical protein [Mycobacteroides sp. CBMA 326]MUM23298.1 DUF1707 domain-containing protein [Mycobacteroides sp. CBMA 271]